MQDSVFHTPHWGVPHQGMEKMERGPPTPSPHSLSPSLASGRLQGGINRRQLSPERRATQSQVCSRLSWWRSGPSSSPGQRPSHGGPPPSSHKPHLQPQVRTWGPLIMNHWGLNSVQPMHSQRVIIRVLIHPACWPVFPFCYSHHLNRIRESKILQFTGDHISLSSTFAFTGWKTKDQKGYGGSGPQRSQWGSDGTRPGSVLPAQVFCSTAWHRAAHAAR